MNQARIYLSPPHMSGEEESFVHDAFASNWVAPLGPHVDAFEREFSAVVGADHAAALSSGTAALHLALQLVGVGPGDDVLVSTFTFAASVNPIMYLGASPIFVDCEPRSWNMDPDLLREALVRRTSIGRKPAAIVLAHLYGQVADLHAISAAATEFGVPLIEDAAEALGASHGDSAAGTIGEFGIFSFNGNKIITTSGGGMLIGKDASRIAHARKLATQAREPALHYEHTEIGYNYRLSNVLAGIGRAQLRVLDQRVAARRNVFDRYVRALGDLPGFAFMPEAPWGRSTRWLTTLTLDPTESSLDPTRLCSDLEAENIEARPLWKPMHMQPVFRGCASFGGSVAEQLFAAGVCLPSGSSLSDRDQERVIDVIRHSATGRTASTALPAPTSAE